jgi:hypothetical protein
MIDRGSFHFMYANFGSHFCFYCMHAKIGWLHKYRIAPRAMQLGSLGPIYDI